MTTDILSTYVYTVSSEYFAEVNCGPPPFVPNSDRHVPGHSYNDTVTYECDAGYRLEGNDSIVCQVHGHWTLPPTCQGMYHTLIVITAREIIQLKFFNIISIMWFSSSFAF